MSGRSVAGHWGAWRSTVVASLPEAVGICFSAAAKTHSFDPNSRACVYGFYKAFGTARANRSVRIPPHKNDRDARISLPADGSSALSGKWEETHQQVATEENE